MSKHANIVGVAYQDCFNEEAQKAVVDDCENVNWGAAFYADPGVSKCPGCEEYYWWESDKLQCPSCGTTWDTNTKQIVN